MGRTTLSSKAKHTITWDQFQAFATASGRDISHVFRVFKGTRESQTLASAFQRHFGFPMHSAALAGRKRASAA